MGISKKYVVAEFKDGLALPKCYTLTKTMWNHKNTGDKRTVQEVFISTLLENILQDVLRKPVRATLIALQKYQSFFLTLGTAVSRMG